MLAALYNLALLAETGVLTYLTGKLGLDWAWSQAVDFICAHNVWNTPEFEELLVVLHRNHVQ